MIPSQACVRLVEQFEGCRLAAYQDSVGVWTIGYGHTGGVAPGQTCTQEEADQWLAQDLDRAAQGVSVLLHVPVTQSQFDALVSFVFNLGAGALTKSTLLRLLNDGNADAASSEFPKWSFADGQFVEGLHRRRLAEQELFRS